MTSVFPLHRIKITDQVINGLNLFILHLITLSPYPRLQTSVTLSLSNRNLIPLTLKVMFSASLSLSLSQILNLKSSKPGISSPNPLVSYSHTNALCLSLSNLYSPFTNFIRNLKTQIFIIISLQSSPFKSLHLRSSQQ